MKNAEEWVDKAKVPIGIHHSLYSVWQVYFLTSKIVRIKAWYDLLYSGECKSEGSGSSVSGEANSSVSISIPRIENALPLTDRVRLPKDIPG